MRDPNRIKPFLAEVERLWMKNPDLRFGQLVLNALEAVPHGVAKLYNKEDAILLAHLRRLYDK